MCVRAARECERACLCKIWRCCVRLQVNKHVKIKAFGKNEKDKQKTLLTTMARTKLRDIFFRMLFFFLSRLILVVCVGCCLWVCPRSYNCAHPNFVSEYNKMGINVEEPKEIRREWKKAAEMRQKRLNSLRIDGKKAKIRKSNSQQTHTASTVNA